MTEKRDPLEEFVRIDDRASIRYAIRPAAIDAVADGSASREDTLFYLRGGQTVRVSLKLDEVTIWLSKCWSTDDEDV